MSAQPTQVQQLARFAVACRDTGVPDEVAADATDRVRDVLGNALAAYAEDRQAPGAPSTAVLEVVRRWGGTPEAIAVASGTRLPGPSAALVNGTLAHALDFDDTHLPSVLHPSASVVPAALAAAQQARASGPRLLAAVAAGIEICNRLGLASYSPEMRNSTFFERGQHATSICGTLAAAAAAATIYGLDEDGIAHAIGIAASMGSGLLEANRTGGTVKRVHCGWAAHGGLVAADLARAGITGPPTVIEGRFGFFYAWLQDDVNLAALTDGLGERWEVSRTVYKPYPSNHFTHPGIDCALALRAAELDPADVESLELGAPASTLRTIAEPEADKKRPQSEYHAKFSGPFTVATALLGGGGLGVYLDDFQPGAHLDPRRLALADKVRCVPDPQATQEFPLRFGAVLTARTKRGSVLTHRVESSRGGPGNPLTAEEIALKFRLNTKRALPDSRVADLQDAIHDLARGGTGERAVELTATVEPVDEGTRP